MRSGSTQRASKPARSSRSSAAQAEAARAATANPHSAISIASARQASRPRRPCRAASATHPATAPGTVTERGPRSSTGATGSARRGAGPAASRPSTASPAETMAKASPPMPVDIGSVTQSTAAAASAASAALPPCSSIRSPARVASGWLVATMPSAATAGGRPYAKRNAISLGGSGQRGDGRFVPSALLDLAAPPLPGDVEVGAEPHVWKALDVAEQLVDHGDARVAADAEWVHHKQETASDAVGAVELRFPDL